MRPDAGPSAVPTTGARVNTLFLVISVAPAAAIVIASIVRPALARAALRRWGETYAIALHEAKADPCGYERFPAWSLRSRECFRIRITTPDGVVRTGSALAGPAGLFCTSVPPVDVRWDEPPGSA